jgi:hypothetical protein
LLEDFRRAGIYAAKILGAARGLGNLPIEQASKFTLVVNAKTAKATWHVAIVAVTDRPKH